MTLKTGGRQKGMPNKINQQVRDRLSELHCSPWRGLNALLGIFNIIYNALSYFIKLFPAKRWAAPPTEM